MTLQRTSGIGTLRGGADGLAVRVNYRAVLKFDGEQLVECSGTLMPVVPGRLLPSAARALTLHLEDGRVARVTLLSPAGDFGSLPPVDPGPPIAR